MYSLQLEKELAISRRLKETNPLFKLNGCEILGSCLKVVHTWMTLLTCQSISGANKPAYAPEPFDVGRYLEAEIVSNGQTTKLTTSSLIQPGCCNSSEWAGLMFLTYFMWES